jgi:hypothetical protein
MTTKQGSAENPNRILWILRVHEPDSAPEVSPCQAKPLQQGRIGRAKVNRGRDFPRVDPDAFVPLAGEQGSRIRGETRKWPG